MQFALCLKKIVTKTAEFDDYFMLLLNDNHIQMSEQNMFASKE